MPSLARLVGMNLDVCLTVTKPDARRGRGRRVGRCAVKRFALEKGLMLYQPRRLSAGPGEQLLKRLKPDVGVVVAFGEVLAPWLIGMFPRGLFNVHASLLPKYRGAAPINHAILNGEKYSGVTVQRVVPELDAGPILGQKKTEIGRREDAASLHDRLSVLGARCLGEILAGLQSGENPPETAQDDSRATYAPKLTKSDGRIVWSRSAEEIRNRIRAMTPWPGAFCMYRGREREEKVTLMDVEHAGRVVESAPGTVVDLTEGEQIVVAAGDGSALRIGALKPAGGRAMSAADFIHGRHVEAGDCFL